MQHHAAWFQKTMGFFENTFDIFERHFMQEHARVNDVERFIFKVRMLGIHLMEVRIDAI